MFFFTKYSILVDMKAGDLIIKAGERETREKSRRVATCKPGKPGLTSSSETLALFFIQFFSFWKMKIQDRQNDPSKSFCYVTFLLCL